MLKDWLDLERNPYDRIGHFVQGFVPVLIAREVLLRNRFLTSKAMTAFLCICVAMTVSALYELIEWLSAVLAGGGAVEFLGTQGDPWDAQGDMLMALIGAIAGLATLSRLHDRQMEEVAAAGRAKTG
jgi:putative membrane protein